MTTRETSRIEKGKHVFWLEPFNHYDLVDGKWSFVASGWQVNRQLKDASQRDGRAYARTLCRFHGDSSLVEASRKLEEVTR